MPEVTDPYNGRSGGDVFKAGLRRALVAAAVLTLAAMVVLTVALAAQQPYAPLLSADHLADIARLLDSDRSRLDLEREEMDYQNIVSAQTMADLVEMYAPANAERVQVAYVSFTPEAATSPAEDRGYGLHIVKRLELPAAGGETRTIYVNEQWREDKATKGLCLPDEIRIQTQVRQGSRRVTDSEKLYIFDLIRVGWGPFNRDPQIARRTIYRRVDGKNEIKPTRSSVSAPFSCTSCHASDNRLAAAFLAPGEERNYEAIVQDRYFQLPPEQMRGYRDYISYLERSGADAEFVQRVKTRLADIRTASAVPGLFERLTSLDASDGVIWLSEDSQLESLFVNVAQHYQGVYQDALGHWRTDALEDVVEGKYVWWEPLAVIP
jgi:hypothetical protein